MEEVKSLIIQGADIHAKNDEPLRWATIKGHLEIVKFLIENGADIHAGHDLALRWALGNNYVKIVSDLCSYYENKEDAFKIILKNLFFIKNDISVIKNIIDNYDLNLDKEFLKTIKEKHPSIYNELMISKEIRLTKNSIKFDIG